MLMTTIVMPAVTSNLLPRTLISRPAMGEAIVAPTTPGSSSQDAVLWDTPIAATARAG